MITMVMTMMTMVTPAGVQSADSIHYPAVTQCYSVAVLHTIQVLHTADSTSTFKKILTLNNDKMRMMIMTMMSMMVMMTTAMMMVTMHNFAVYLFVPKLGLQILGWNRGNKLRVQFVAQLCPDSVQCSPKLWGHMFQNISI